MLGKATEKSPHLSWVLKGELQRAGQAGQSMVMVVVGRGGRPSLVENILLHVL